MIESTKERGRKRIGEWEGHKKVKGIKIITNLNLLKGYLIIIFENNFLFMFDNKNCFLFSIIKNKK